MNELINKVEGIGKEYQSKLEYVGIRTVSELIAKTQKEEDRIELARVSEIPQGHLDNWASMLDLTRIEGVGYQYAELMVYSGIKSVEDFRKRNPEKLHDEMKSTNDKKHFAGIVPSSGVLAGFMEDAKRITNIVERY